MLLSPGGREVGVSVNQSWWHRVSPTRSERMGKERIEPMKPCSGLNFKLSPGSTGCGAQE